MLSVLIPTYNYNCTPLLDALLAQKAVYENIIEIIVCDDCSTNTQVTESLKKICSDKDTHFIKNKQNMGRAATRDILTRKASYEWLLFLDSDILPTSDRFLSNYVKHLKGNYQAIVGGIAYQKAAPDNAYRLRWKFGIKREARPAVERNKQPYLMASGNFLIKKETFIKANSFLKNKYGLDALFGYELKKLKTPIIHIDNPVYHLGLETNAIFLEKSIKALDTMVSMENEGLLPKNHTRLQQLYNTISGKTILKYVIGFFKNPIKKNLVGRRPSLILFDLYKLYHYISRKSNA